MLFAVQRPFHKALLTGKTTHLACRFEADLRFMAKRMGANTIEVKASHHDSVLQADEGCDCDFDFMVDRDQI